ncbi:MAG: 50S ribosomal protein L10 [Spirochaetales bacterium]|nr:50S ribosomal protein L10 [Spirochaetales bacterium]
MTETVKKVQQYKVEALNRTKEVLSGYNDLIFSDFRGLNVEQITELRTKLREINAYYKVIKNSYLRRAAKEMEMPDLSEVFIGPTAVALVKDDPGAAAKVLFNFTKDTTLKIKGALVDGQVFSEADVQALSKLPSRDDLYAQLMGTINAPLTNLMYAMNGVILKFVRTLQAVADSKEN